MGFRAKGPKLYTSHLGSALNATPGLVEDALQARVLRILPRQFQDVGACQKCLLCIPGVKVSARMLGIGQTTELHAFVCKHRHEKHVAHTHTHAFRRLASMNHV